jgi:hypothetical protein
MKQFFKYFCFQNSRSSDWLLSMEFCFQNDTRDGKVHHSYLGIFEHLFRLKRYVKM